MQEVGYYNPRSDQTQLNVPAILTLLRHGVQPTETVTHILQRAGVFQELQSMPCVEERVEG